MYKTAYFDTGVIIRLLDSNHRHHASALSYLRHLQENGYILRISTIAIAEYCVKGSYDDLPTENILPSPFNTMHALKAGAFASVLLEEKSKWVSKKGERSIIKNDASLMAQAECDKADCYITFDTESKRLYDILRENRQVSFAFWDANNPISNYTGDIPFEE